MQRISETNRKYTGASGRVSLYDLSIPENWNQVLIIFSHGYMGYKDWGAWNLMESYFVERGYGFLKYNISHNGGTAENGIDFPDLEAFSQNSYSKELIDMECIIELAQNEVKDIDEIILLGHSRGGGMVLLQSQHPSISKIIALAPISDIGKRFPVGDALEKWKSEGVYFRTNGRTQQEMPHEYSQYEDFVQNEDRLNIEYYCKHAHVPIFVIHGEDDTSVRMEEGEAIASWTRTPIIRIPNEQHTFGAKQPWNESGLPNGLKTVCEHIFAILSK